MPTGSKEDPTIAGDVIPKSVIERLRRDKAHTELAKSAEEEARQASKERDKVTSRAAGRQWAMDEACVDDLRFIAEWNASTYSNKHTALHHRVKSYIADVEAFVEGALDVWDQVKDRL